MITAGWQDEAIISFKVTGDAQFLLPKFLRQLQHLGQAGASRNIIIENGRLNDDSDFQIGFDGDGADKISDIIVNGKPFEGEPEMEASK